jgi:metal-responsive CopG/Arc/MetJ family transcriptional regulator
MNTKIAYDRVTFSLPSSINLELDKLKKEQNRSKSEIIKIAIENYINEQKRKNLQKAVELMANEYENNKALTEFSVLDSEDFI